MNLACWEYIAGSGRLKQILELVPGGSVDAKSKTMGFSAPSVYSYLAGKNKFPLEFLIKLQELTDVSFDWLLTGEGNQFKGKDAIQRRTIDSDYFLLVRDAVDDLIHSEKCGNELNREGYLDFIVYTYNMLINKLETLDFDKALLAVMPALKNKLNSIKEVHSLSPESFEKHDEEKVERYTEEDQALDMAASIEELIDKKIEEFAKANQLAPPQKK